MKITGRLMVLVAVILSGCSDGNSVESRTNLLVDVQWVNSEAIGSAPTGYTITSPIVFKRDKKVYIGGSPTQWTFIDFGHTIVIGDPGSAHHNRYEIVSLTESEFHFKHYDGAGNFMMELKYVCNRSGIGPL